MGSDIPISLPCGLRGCAAAALLTPCDLRAELSPRDSPLGGMGYEVDMGGLWTQEMDRLMAIGVLTVDCC